MKPIVMLGLAAFVLAGVAMLSAAEFTSGLQPGDLVPPFDIEKCGGAVNDGKEIGANFCYRCMLGNKPVVMIFAHNPDEKLAALVRAIDKKVIENDDQKLSSFVNLIGKDQVELKAKARDFADKYKIENVALVVPQEYENGPAEIELNPQADVTVTIYRNGKVVVSHAIPAGQLTADRIQAIVNDTNQILN
jgi:hypothetical protein